MIHPSMVLFVAAIAMVASSSGHIGGHSSFQDASPQIYCGRNLARAVAMICYEMENFEKRSDGETMYNSILSPYHKEQESFNGPWMPSYKAMGLGSNRAKRYVVNECCEKACSISELQSYC